MLRWTVWFLGTMAMLCAGCATPGAPQPPSLRLPQPVKDLQAIRKGDNVYLRWTVPSKTTDGGGIKAAKLGVTRVCRGYVTEEANTCRDIAADVETKADATGHQSAMDHVASFVGGNRDFLSYTVKVNNEKGRNAGPSNSVIIFVAPSLAAPPAPDARLQPNKISLAWEAHELPQSSTLRAEYFYRLKRAPKDSPALTLTEIPARPGQMRFDDTTFTWEKTYEYRVAGVTRVLASNGKTLAEFEGEDSPPATVLAHDIFPPPVPKGLQAVYSAQDARHFIDLTWSPDSEGDIAGYNVYRSDGGASAKINRELVKTSSFRDDKVAPAKTYQYSVTTVDARGNESTRSEATSEKVPE